jgi:hypothetical protein
MTKLFAGKRMLLEIDFYTWTSLSSLRSEAEPGAE